MNASSILRRLWASSPQANARRVAQRLHPFGGPDVEELLRSGKHARPQRPYDYLSRYEAILKRAIGWQPLEFRDRAALEVGCGPLLGFAPLAVFLGCRTFVGIEPDADLSALHDPRIRERYLLKLFKDLTGIYGSGPTFPEFIANLESRVSLRREFVESVHADELFDIVLSNSTLEHLVPLEPSIRRLLQLQAHGARFLHLVDFGNHRETRNPFAGMYVVEPDEYRRRHGSGINLARAPDVKAAFANCGADVAVVPYYSFREFYDERPLAWWTDRYSEEELFLKAAVVCSPR